MAVSLVPVTTMLSMAEAAAPVRLMVVTFGNAAAAAMVRVVVLVICGVFKRGVGIDLRRCPCRSSAVRNRVPSPRIDRAEELGAVESHGAVGVQAEAVVVGEAVGDATAAGAAAAVVASGSRWCASRRAGSGCAGMAAVIRSAVAALLDGADVERAPRWPDVGRGAGDGLQVAPPLFSRRVTPSIETARCRRCSRRR